MDGISLQRFHQRVAAECHLCGLAQLFYVRAEVEAVRGTSGAVYPIYLIPVEWLNG